MRACVQYSIAITMQRQCVCVCMCDVDTHRIDGITCNANKSNVHTTFTSFPPSTLFL